MIDKKLDYSSECLLIHARVASIAIGLGTIYYYLSNSKHWNFSNLVDQGKACSTSYKLVWSWNPQAFLWVSLICCSFSQVYL